MSTAFCTLSATAYEGLLELDYPFRDKSVVITTCGRICFQRRKINLSQVFAGQMAGIRQVDGRVWLVSFMNYDLGYFAETECGLEPIDCAAPIQNDSTAQGLFVAAEEL